MDDTDAGFAGGFKIKPQWQASAELAVPDGALQPPQQLLTRPLQ
jgi:hypothetical protein